MQSRTGVKYFEPRLIIDLATLTGASIIALGANVAAMMGMDKMLKNRLQKMSDETGEKIGSYLYWMNSMTKSKVALLT